MLSPTNNPTADGFVKVRGAREHNLKNIDVDIPRNALVVFSGISGSGKSSLAFGTLYAEAQRRYFESVAPYARRLIDQAGVPAVDSIEGLPPAVALQQQRGTPNARSSVGSMTTLSSLLRMLYSRAGHYPRRQPMLYAEDFSPNTPQGACPHCQGLGSVYDVTEALMVPDTSLTIRERAIAAWPAAWHGQNLRDILVSLGVDIDVPWRKLAQKQRQWILYTDEQPTAPVYAGYSPAETRRALRRKEEPSYMGTFTGVRRYVLDTFATTQSALMKKRVAQYLVAAPCTECHGKRLNAAALSVRFAGRDISELSQLSLTELAAVLEPYAAEIEVTPPLTAEKRLAAQRLAQDALHRLRALRTLGLGYLSLDRSTPTLSPGELQRLRLATQIHSQLFGVIYVMDEPSAGLHPADSAALMQTLGALKAAGNTLFVVEHDLATMRQADWLIDVGPGAGTQGGEILYSGPPDGLRAVTHSATAPYLFRDNWPIPAARRKALGWLELGAITRNNLHKVSARIPLGVLTAITGVSGSGKSTLASQVLVERVANALGQTLSNDDDEETLPTAATSAGTLVFPAEHIRRLVRIDQKPIGRTPRSNLATYTGLFNVVRKLFAATPAARRRRYDAGQFSFNVSKGRCETCEGEGFVSVELLFMPSVYAPCPTCHGARYNTRTLQITWHEKNIADVLQLTVADACDFFRDEPAVLRPVQLLRELGLGYLRLGQPATELSGGEAQRIKLATELQRTTRGTTLYVMDEPTTGLHPADVDRLFEQLRHLVEAGNSVVMVEHDLRIVAQCDWVIDLGPGAGNEGGKIVATGTPEQVAQSATSRTAPFLRDALHG